MFGLVDCDQVRIRLYHFCGRHVLRNFSGESMTESQMIKYKCKHGFLQFVKELTEVILQLRYTHENIIHIFRLRFINFPVQWDLPWSDTAELYLTSPSFVNVQGLREPNGIPEGP